MIKRFFSPPIFPNDEERTRTAELLNTVLLALMTLALVALLAFALGGTVRVGQVQLAQPILGMLFSVPLLGETLDLVTATFGLAIVGTVFASRRLATRG